MPTGKTGNGAFLDLSLTADATESDNEGKDNRRGPFFPLSLSSWGFFRARRRCIHTRADV